ncbi:MAG TPA: hypothetical protein VLE89_08095 [Chlamydiales bacterium]|nr:hypothetical protein [Chlamydiales bacterium]
MIKKVLFFLLFLGVSLSLPAGFKRLTHGFRLAKLQLDFPYHPEWERSRNQEVEEILRQPFFFLNKGAQCYAFRSADDKYVLKLFRYDQRSLFFRNKKKSPLIAKITKLFDACKMAYDLAPEETGLLYIHLNPSSDLPRIRCKDALGRSYRIPLNSYRFALQRKAEPFRKTLLKARNNPLEMQKRIDQFLTLLEHRTAKGIGNSDPNLSRNFGFLETCAIEFDFGNYGLSPDLQLPQYQIPEMKRYTHRLRRWLKKEAPEWVAYFDERVESIGFSS